MPENLTIEQRIHIAGNYEEEKIKMIRELMEEVAIGSMYWLDADCSNANGEWTIYKNEHGFPNGIYTTKQLYELYQQSKNQQPNTL